MKMKNYPLDWIRKNASTLRIVLPVLALLCICTLSFADVGNNNRYSSGTSGGDGDGLDVIISYLIGLLIENPTLGLIFLIIFIIYYFVKKKNAGEGGNTNWSAANNQVSRMAASDNSMDNTSAVAAQIQALDPDFSSDKFIGFAREVFMKIQEAWTQKDWTIIRPFENETLFNQHEQQLDEYIRQEKTNVVEKIGIKQCTLNSFRQDGDKEVIVVWLSAIMRDYVIDDKTKKVLESDPGRDWYMRYEMVFNRKAGLKTDTGRKGFVITNCPNCGAPTEVTSSGQCTYCGSVITNGDHDWVLTDIRSRN